MVLLSAIMWVPLALGISRLYIRSKTRSPYMKTSERCERHFFALIAFHRGVLNAAPTVLERIIKALETIARENGFCMESTGKDKVVQTFNTPIKESDVATIRPKVGQFEEKEDPRSQMNVPHSPDEWKKTDVDQTTECTSGSQESTPPGSYSVPSAPAFKQRSYGYFPRGNQCQNYYIDDFMRERPDADFWIQMKERWES